MCAEIKHAVVPRTHVSSGKVRLTQKRRRRAHHMHHACTLYMPSELYFSAQAQY